MYSLTQYLCSIEDLFGVTRTLGDWEPCRLPDGGLWYASGNTAIVFRIRRGDQVRALRCYRRPMPRLRAIYGDRLLEEELFLFTGTESGVWVDAVLDRWVEGISLRQAIFDAARRRDTRQLTALAQAFDRLGCELLADDWAHGDLKPENIVVDAAGALHLIDFDACYLPAFAGEASSELGTAAYQHPKRTVGDFHAGLDDYPIALVSTALHALRAEPGLIDRYGCRDGLLFDPLHIAGDEALREVLALFAQQGSAAPYRIAELLRAPTLRLPQLPMLLAAAHNEVERETVPAKGAETDTDEPAVDAWPELFVEGGRWGYRTAEATVIPPLYDCGFDFTEGLAAVQLADRWHFIDPAGRPVIHCPACDAVKPFRNGEAVLFRNGCRFRIDRKGRMLN